jgi:hypothetical protein
MLLRGAWPGVGLQPPQLTTEFVEPPREPLELRRDRAHPVVLRCVHATRIAKSY